MSHLFASHLPLAPGDTDTEVILSSPGNSWTPGTPGSPTFTVSGGSSASIVAQGVIGPNCAILNLNVGTAPGLLTIGDPSTGATATIQIKNRVRRCPSRPRSRQHGPA